MRVPYSIYYDINVTVKIRNPSKLVSIDPFRRNEIGPVKKIFNRRLK